MRSGSACRASLIAGPGRDIVEVLIIKLMDGLARPFPSPPVTLATLLRCPLEQIVMNRKWTVSGLFAGVLVTLAAAAFSTAQDKKHGELEEIMEKVQKHNGVIVKGIRNPAFYKKTQKDIEKSSLELAKIAKEIKPIKEALKRAKDTKNPGAEWEKICDEFYKTSEAFAKLVAKSETTQAEAKTAFNSTVKKTCTDCHAIFKVEE